MTNKKSIKVPDIGGAANVDVIEILVKKGEKIEKDASLITLESDKASMEIPSPQAGIVDEIKLKIGDKVSEGDEILILIAEESKQDSKPSEKPAEKPPAKKEAEPEAVTVKEEPQQSSAPPKNEFLTKIYAGPAVRRLAFELGVNLEQVSGSGRKERITKEDLHNYVKAKLSSGSTGFSLPTAPAIDFSQFGEIEKKPLNKIKKLTGVNVHRAWVTIPHVTQFDEADITELEAFRKSESEQAAKEGVKLTMLAFVCKIVSTALIEFPQFNASLDATSENLIYKKYVNIGIAVETPNGLVVPVIKNVMHLSILDIAKEMGRLSTKAREKGLMPGDMNGGCFTISSLGGIGGTAFTPIVNSPEVAILGLSRSQMKPIYFSGEFKPRLMLPLSLSYDHRVIDGAEAARFTRFLANQLEDIRKLLLIDQKGS